MSLDYYKAEYQGKTIFFSCTNAQVYGDENIFFAWEENGGEGKVDSLPMPQLVELTWTVEA